MNSATVQQPQHCKPVFKVEASLKQFKMVKNTMHIRPFWSKDSCIQNYETWLRRSYHESCNWSKHYLQLLFAGSSPHLQWPKCNHYFPLRKRNTMLEPVWHHHNTCIYSNVKHPRHFHMRHAGRNASQCRHQVKYPTAYKHKHTEKVSYR